MKLHKQTAEQIVKRAMQIIPHSVNVMDETGMIIASGDPKRLNQHHTGAVLALRRNQAVEIDENLAKQWHLRAGINLPITYLGQNIGVIGISGEPNNVRPYGELVKMAAELIIESNAQLEQARWQHRYKEEFVRQLLLGHLDELQLQKQARFFHFSLEQPSLTIIIKLRHPNQHNLQTLLNHLAQYFPQLATMVSALDQIVLLYPLQPAEKFDKSRLQQFIPAPNSLRDYTLSIGQIANNFRHIHQSYQTALHTLHYAERHAIQKHVLFFHEHKLPVLLTEFGQSWQGKALLANIQPLIQHDPHQQLQKTLHHYFCSNCDLDHAAQKLFIHPNTLRYRLDKIEQITGLSFNKIEHKFMLYLGTILHTNL